MAFGPAGIDLAAALVLGLRSALTSLVIVVLMESEQVTTANIGLAYGLWFSAVQIGGALGRRSSACSATPTSASPGLSSRWRSCWSS